MLLLLPTCCILLFTLFNTAHATCGAIEWIGARFEFPCEEIERKYRNTSEYIPKNGIALRALISEDHIYTCTPRFRPGIPVTLARLDLKSRSCEAMLIPFPDLRSQEVGRCNALQSVVDLYLDKNGRLWCLDVGVVDMLGTPLRKSTPKVVAFNLTTGTQFKILDLSGLVVQASRLQYVVVDDGCDTGPFVYITDAATRSVLVYDVANDRGYRVVLPKAAAGCKRDVLYAALVCKTNGNNLLVLTYLSGSRIFGIPTEYLRAGSAEGHIEDLGPKDCKLVFVGTDGGSVVFYRCEGRPGVYRWDVNQGVFCRGPLVYTSPMCYLVTNVMPDVKRNRMRVLESNFPDYHQETVGCGASQRVALMVSEVAQ